MNNKNENLFLENDYIEWLSRFILEHRDFNTDDIKSLFKNIEEEDKNNILKLNYFYDLIDNYATDSNDLLPNFYSLGNYFKIKYNNEKLIIGKSTIYDQENYFCKKGYPFGKYVNYQEIQSYYLDNSKGKKI